MARGKKHCQLNINLVPDVDQGVIFVISSVIYNKTVRNELEQMRRNEKSLKERKIIR